MKNACGGSCRHWYLLLKDNPDFEKVLRKVPSELLLTEEDLDWATEEVEV